MIMVSLIISSVTMDMVSLVTVGHRHQSLDALYGPSFNLQRKPMAPITAADSSRSFTIDFTHDEQQSVIKRMINMNLISDSKTKELSPHHVQLLNTMFANKKKRLECFNEKKKKRKNTLQKRFCAQRLRTMKLLRLMWRGVA